MLFTLLGWGGMFFTLAGAFLLARQISALWAFRLFLVASALLLPIQFANHIWNQVATQCCFIVIDLIGLYTIWQKKKQTPTPQTCTREQPHSGPCNGWPCATVMKVLRGSG